MINISEPDIRNMINFHSRLCSSQLHTQSNWVKALSWGQESTTIFDYLTGAICQTKNVNIKP